MKAREHSMPVGSLAAGEMTNLTARFPLPACNPTCMTALTRPSGTFSYKVLSQSTDEYSQNNNEVASRKKTNLKICYCNKTSILSLRLNYTLFNHTDPSTEVSYGAKKAIIFFYLLNQAKYARSCSSIRLSAHFISETIERISTEFSTASLLQNMSGEFNFGSYLHSINLPETIQ